jgi:hypothetical protein
MKALRGLLLAAGLSLPSLAAGQAPPTTPPEEPEEATLGLEASIYAYFPPQGRIYGQPTIAFDHEALHLEARYNYEDLRTGSMWVGWNFGFGDALRFDGTLMAGGVVGDELKGVAPGYKLTVTWKRLELYSEGEYVVDVNDSANDFLYNWAQLGFYPLEWLSIGFASQRTRVYETGLDVQRGPYVGVSMHGVTLSVYVFNPDHKPTVVAAMAASF